MDSVQLSDIGSVESCQAVDSDALIFGDDDKLTIILRELEAAHDVTNVDLVPEHNRVGTIDHDIVTVFAHDSKEGLHNDVIILNTQFLTLVIELLPTHVRDRLSCVSAHAIQISNLNVALEGIRPLTSDRL